MAKLRVESGGFNMQVFGRASSWADELQAFCQKFPNWFAARATSEPIYCLPQKSIDVLSRASGDSPPLIDGPSAIAERAFTKLCRTHQSVGCWNNRRIPLSLVDRPGMVTPAEMKRMGWSGSAVKIAAAFKKADDAALRCKGVLGWLLTEPAFINQTAELFRCWQSLPQQQRPSFPLTRPVVVLAPPARSRQATPASVDFANALKSFLDRWGLIQLLTWDLPEPQGPLLPSLLSPGSQAIPAHGIHLILPVHYALQANDTLLRDILTQQQQTANSLGIDASIAGLPHNKGYATLFDVLHGERSIRSRLDTSQLGRGQVTRLEKAIGAALKLSVAAVQKYRKAVVACQRGNRHKVPWLRPRSR